MFHTNSACDRAGSCSTSARSMWLTAGGLHAWRDAHRPDNPHPCPAGADCRSSTGIPAPGLHRLPVSAGRSAQARMTLPPVVWRCRPWPSHSSDGPAAYRCAARSVSARGHPGECAQLRRIARRDRGLELLPALHVSGDEFAVDEAVAVNHVQHRECERRVAAGKGLQMNVGLRGGRCSNGVDDDHLPGRLGQPVIVRMGRRCVRVRSPYDDAARRRAPRADRNRRPTCRTCSAGRRGRPCCKSCRASPRWRPSRLKNRIGAMPASSEMVPV